MKLILTSITDFYIFCYYSSINFIYMESELARKDANFYVCSALEKLNYVNKLR
jgi:hypothetical protein